MFDQIYNYIVHQLATNQFFSAAALSGVLMSLLYTLKSLPVQGYWRLRRYFTYSVTIEQGQKLFKYVDV